jgi:hypothetical protein
MYLTGLPFVYKKRDELTKNHRENDRSSSSGIMPAIPGNPLCPVASFTKYLEKLHPRNDSLWQRPRDSFIESDAAWYCNSTVGEKTLGKFMTKVSTACKLSDMYTNHSIRATGATLLSKSGFNHAQIMSVTGHKSVASMAVYQNVDQDEKLLMGQAIASGLGVPSANMAILPPPQQRALAATATVTSGSDLALDALPLPLALTNTVNTDGMADIDALLLSELMTDYDSIDQRQQPGPLANVTNTMTQRLSAQMPVFNSCRIGNITININK